MSFPRERLNKNKKKKKKSTYRVRSENFGALSQIQYNAQLHTYSMSVQYSYCDLSISEHDTTQKTTHRIWESFFVSWSCRRQRLLKFLFME